MTAPELRIRTPEGIAFSFALAGPITRFLAWLIDLAAISAAGIVLNILFQLLGLISADLARGLLMLSYFAMSIAYGILMEWGLRGQTLGKRLLRLRVMDERGLNLQFSQIVIRNLVRFVDMLPFCYLIGGIACLLSKRAQRLGDFAANTVVVRHTPLLEPDLDQLASGKWNSLRGHPHLVARLRQMVSPAEAQIAVQAVLRRDELEPEPRAALFTALAAHFKEAVRFPEESIETIADEQFVRNVVDVTFRGTKLDLRSGAAAEKNVALKASVPIL